MSDRREALAARLDLGRSRRITSGFNRVVQRSTSKPPAVASAAPKPPATPDAEPRSVTSRFSIARRNTRPIFRFLRTPHLPHCWEAGLLFEETQRTLFCSDLVHQGGEHEAVTSANVVGRVEQTLREYEAGPFAGYVPWTAREPVADVET